MTGTVGKYTFQGHQDLGFILHSTYWHHVSVYISDNMVRPMVQAQWRLQGSNATPYFDANGKFKDPMVDPIIPMLRHVLIPYAVVQSTYNIYMNTYQHTYRLAHRILIRCAHSFLLF